MIVSAGLALPWVGSALPSVMNRFDTSQQRWSLSTTLFSGDVPIRQPPIRWAYRSMLSTSCAPAASQISFRTRFA